VAHMKALNALSSLSDPKIWIRIVRYVFSTAERAAEWSSHAFPSLGAGLAQSILLKSGRHFSEAVEIVTRATLGLPSAYPRLTLRLPSAYPRLTQKQVSSNPVT